MRFYCESHFVLEKLRLIKEERDALLYLLAEELAKMPELGLFPMDSKQPIKLPSVEQGGLPCSILSSRLHKARLLAEYLIENVINHVCKLNLKLGEALADPHTLDLMHAQINELQDPEVVENHREALNRYHREAGPGIVDTESYYSAILDTLRLSEEELDKMFTGAENYGRYLDMYPTYDLYRKIVHSDSFGYLRFLHDYANVERIPKKERMDHHYKGYLENCCKYLSSFIAKSFPLVRGIEDRVRELKIKFEDDWEKGIYSDDWAETIAEISVVQPCSDLYCLPCQHLFTNAAVYDAHLKGKKHLKAVEKCAQSYVDASQVEAATEKMRHERLDKIHALAWSEKLVKFYASLLEKTQRQTIENLERRQAMTPEEIQKEEQLLAQQDAEFENLLNDEGAESKEAQVDGLQGRASGRTI